MDSTQTNQLLNILNGLTDTIGRVAGTAVPLAEGAGVEYNIDETMEHIEFELSEAIHFIKEQLRLAQAAGEAI